MNYYNEFDPFAAETLRNLIAAGHIAPGVVDERSIEDVKPDELLGYTQCHFFAGVGVWSLALRRAGWPDDRKVWTGSCPCQPFSAAGKGNGFADERHLWPAFYHLISQCRPPAIYGEQVAAKAVEPWIDLVHADLEALGYAFGCVPFPSAGVGAPHIRDRAYWVANATNQRHEWPGLARGRRDGPAHIGAIGRLADLSSGGRREEHADAGGGAIRDGTQGIAAGLVHGGSLGGVANVYSHGRDQAGERVAQTGDDGFVRDSTAGGLADDFMQQRPDRQRTVSAVHDQGGRVEGAAEAAGLRSDCGMADTIGGKHEPGSAQPDQRAVAGSHGALQAERGHPGPTNGLWADADWLFCRDGKWRPVEPGTFPLVNGAPSRVGRLRAYGNAINAYQAQVFIEAHLRAMSGANSEPLGATLSTEEKAGQQSPTPTVPDLALSVCAVTNSAQGGV